MGNANEDNAMNFYHLHTKEQNVLILECCKECSLAEVDSMEPFKLAFSQTAMGIEET